MRKRVTRDEFIAIWESAGNVKEVIHKTGCNYATVVGRASGLRRTGVPLKKFQPLSKDGQPRRDGLVTWLKTNYPHIHQEWKDMKGTTDES